VTGSGNAIGSSEGDDTPTPGSELVFPMDSGVGTTLNVGVWVFCEANPGAGDAAGRSLVQGSIAFMNSYR
jgi:hypothetical protein